MSGIRRDSREVRKVSETGGEKGSKLAQFGQIPPQALYELAEHFGRGADKYEAHNFRNGYDWSLSFDACQRHLWQFWGGEDMDEETGSKHLIAAAWHCLCMATFMDEHRDLDDRYNTTKESV
jgi:hypothetical protein